METFDELHTRFWRLMTAALLFMTVWTLGAQAHHAQSVEQGRDNMAVAVSVYEHERGIK